MGNDAPCFSFIHEMLLNALREYFPSLEYGTYHHSADSFHVYERHFEMMEKIAFTSPYVSIECPRISGPDEVRYLRGVGWAELSAQKYSIESEKRPVLLCDEVGNEISEEFQFTRWLTSFDSENR
jgi:hypothetical protein